MYTTNTMTQAHKELDAYPLDHEGFDRLETDLLIGSFDDAEQLGEESFRFGYPQSVCPYDAQVAPGHRSAWLTGWRNAQDRQARVDEHDSNGTA